MTTQLAPHPTAFRLDADLVLALRRIKEEDGIPMAEQLRRALRGWIAAHDRLMKMRRSA